MISALHLPRFEFRRFLGRGALGDVYLAWDRERSQEVALKLVRTATAPPEMLEAERNGALLQERLATVAPQVPGVFASGEESEIFWISMEYVDGVDLADEMGAGPFSEPRAVRIAIELCSFLQALHEFQAEIGGSTIRGIVHGDIKPQNLRLQVGDRVRVLDFGIAKQLSLSRSFTHQPFGSLPYISPERLETGEVNRSSDLWSVGVLLYSMVAGHLPFAGTAASDLEQNIRRGASLPLPGSCSPPLRAIVGKCLHIEAEHRYPSAALLKLDLEAFLEGRYVTLKAQEETVQQTRRTQPSDPKTSHTASSPTSRPRHGGAGAALTAVLCLLATFGACQGYVDIQAKQLRQNLASASGSEIQALWRHYQGLKRLDILGLVPDELRNDMLNGLLGATDRILSRDPEARPHIKKEEWEAAQKLLETALEIDGKNPRARSRLAYCRAEIAIVEATSFQEMGDPEAASHRREDALAEFAEAARFDETWPQPHVAKARIYAELEPVDLARLEGEIAAAEERGFPKAKLTLYRAKGHYAESQRLYSMAIRGRGSDRERDLLARAIESFSRAIDLYEQIPSDPQAESTLEVALRIRQILEDRYAALSLPW